MTGFRSIAHAMSNCRAFPIGAVWVALGVELWALTLRRFVRDFRADS